MVDKYLDKDGDGSIDSTPVAVAALLLGAGAVLMILKQLGFKAVIGVTAKG